MRHACRCRVARATGQGSPPPHRRDCHVPRRTRPGDPASRRQARSVSGKAGSGGARSSPGSVTSSCPPAVLVFRKIVDQRQGAGGDKRAALIGQNATGTIVLEHRKRRYGDVLVVRRGASASSGIPRRARSPRPDHPQADAGKGSRHGSSTGSLPSRTLRNPNCGTCRPSTTRQTVSGVDRSSPTGPQSQVQKIAAARIAIDERPVLAP